MSVKNRPQIPCRVAHHPPALRRHPYSESSPAPRRPRSSLPAAVPRSASRTVIKTVLDEAQIFFARQKLRIPSAAALEKFPSRLEPHLWLTAPPPRRNRHCTLVDALGHVYIHAVDDGHHRDRRNGRRKGSRQPGERAACCWHRNDSNTEHATLSQPGGTPCIQDTFAEGGLFPTE